MANELAAVREIYHLQQERFAEGGFSPQQTAAYARTVEMIQAASTTAEWKAAMDEEKQWDRMTAAARSDYFSATAKAMDESFFGKEVGDAYRAVAEKYAAGYLDQATVSAAEQCEEKAKELVHTERKRLQLLFAALRTILEMSVTPDFFALEKKTMQERLQQIITEIEEHDGFAKLMQDERYRAHLPYGGDKLDAMVALAKSLLDAEYPEPEISPEQRQWIEESSTALLQARPALAQAQASCQGARRLFAVDMAGEEPGEYNYELFWEKL